ncbi:hypothetical protein, partial [Allocoleopsis sp.]|uniref:hypothetical protein n=1 Tax=Allocoleopsis sp. TaxID=3088169 RepID=UPI002FD3ADD2
SIIDRRPHKRDESKDALEKVKHIKDIPFASPTDAQIKKFFELSLVKLYQQHNFSNFDQFHEAWQKTLNGNIKFAKNKYDVKNGLVAFALLLQDNWN